MKNSYYRISTLGSIGYLPAPGTCASVLGFLVGYYLKLYNFNLFYLCVFGFPLIALIINQAIFSEDNKDPKEIVLDEFLASLYIINFINISNYTEISLSFLIFRFFDITKFCGIKYIEKLFPNAFGIIIDDLIAATYTLILIKTIF